MTNARTPGQLIAKLLSRARWSNHDLSMVLGVSEPIVSKMVGDKRPVDAAMALFLEEVFGVPAERFVALQSQYDLAKARLEARPDPKRSTRAAIYGVSRRGDDQARVDSRSKACAIMMVSNRALCRFFKVNRIEDTSVFSFAAKKTDVGAGATPAQLAWLHRVKTIASEMLIGSYSPRNLKSAILKIAALRGHAEHMERVQNSCGGRSVTSLLKGFQAARSTAFVFG